MSLRELRISADAYSVCLTHVLSTESTEVMGVLLGDLDGTDVCRVLSAKVLVRLDKRKDRVEISPDQLMSAAGEADRLAVELGRSVRVVGWYHSHPHITVWPSVVDIGTQDTFQLMDSCFAGLIFSVFPKRQSAGVEVTCFQSVRDDSGALKRRDVPICIEPTRTIAPHCLRALVGLPEALREEEIASYDAVREASAGDQLTQMHNQAVLVRNTTQQLGVLTLPLLQLLENRLLHNQRQLRRLLAERDALTERLGEAVVKREPGAPQAGRAEQGSDERSGTGGRRRRRRLGRQPDLQGDSEETVLRRAPAIKREPNSQGDAKETAARRPGSRSGSESALPQPEAGDASDTSTETVFRPSAAERELGVSPRLRRAKRGSDSDSSASAELTRPRSRRRTVVKQERDSGAEESRSRRRTVVKQERDSGAEESAPEASRGRRLAVVKEEADSGDYDACTGVSRPRGVGGKREREPGSDSGAGRRRAAPAVKQEPDWYLDIDGSQGRQSRETGDNPIGSGSPGKRTRVSVKRETVSPERPNSERPLRGDSVK